MKTIICAALSAALGIVCAADVKTGVAAPTIKTWKFMSESLGEERSVNVLLPADYDASTRRYPVLYLLHGYGDDHTAWSFMTNLSGYAATQPVIVVMPDGARSFFINNASDPKQKFEDFIAKDLVTYVDSRFRTIPLRRSRAVAGLSMGGYGALFLGVKHYQKFAAIGAFSGALAFARPVDAAAPANPRAAEFAKMFGSDPAARAERDPFLLIDKIPAGQFPYLYIACGGQDFLLKSNRDFVALLAEKKLPYEYREVSPKGHTWDFWDDHVKVFLDKLSALDGWR